jgi:hypothetical protein
MDRWTLLAAILVALSLAGCAGAKARPEPDAPLAAGPAAERARADAPAQGGEAAAPIQRTANAASPYLGAEPIELSTPMAMGGPAARTPDAATPHRRETSRTASAAPGASTDAPAVRTTPSSPPPSSASSGALVGLRVVTGAWLGVCLVGGPLTLALCIVAFPEYWPYAVLALAGGMLIGAAVGAVADSVATGGGRNGRAKGRRRMRRGVRAAPSIELGRLFGGGNWSRAVS